MRAINVLLALAVSLFIAALVAEGGLRLLGMGPPNTGLRFDRDLGWSLRPNHEFTFEGKGFRADIKTDAHGLRDDYRGDTTKPAGVFRVLCLGDSFTLGYTVQRDELFVDMLEHWWRAEGRKVEVVNAGVQAYSTDQQLAWLETHGAAWSPDLVLVFPYENDIYWNSQAAYAGSDKPTYDVRGAREPRELADHLSRSHLEQTALGYKLLHKSTPHPRVKVTGTEQEILAEQAVLLVNPPELVLEAQRRTSGILHQMGAVAQKLGAQLALCPIPSKSQIDANYADATMGAKVLKLPRTAWDPALPYQFLLQAAATGTEHVLDPLAALRGAAEPQYHTHDWHLNAAGNHTLARYLHDALDSKGLLPARTTEAALAPPPAETGGLPGWLPVFGVLWLLLGTLYVRTYADENAVGAFLKVGLLLATIFTIAIGGSTLIGMLPPRTAQIA